MENSKRVSGNILPKKYTIARLDKPKVPGKRGKDTTTMTTSGSTCEFNVQW